MDRMWELASVEMYELEYMAPLLAIGDKCKVSPDCPEAHKVIVFSSNNRNYALIKYFTDRPEFRSKSHDILLHWVDVDIEARNKYQEWVLKKIEKDYDPVPLELEYKVVRKEKE